MRPCYAVFLGLYTNWPHRLALSIGLVTGLVVGTWMVVVQNFASSVYPVAFGSFTLPMYAAVAGLVLNLLLCVILTIIFKAIGIVAGEDDTAYADYEVHPVSLIKKPRVYVKRSEA